MFTHIVVEGAVSDLHESVLRQPPEPPGCEAQGVGAGGVPRRAEADVETIQLILRPSHSSEWRYLEAWPKPAYAVWERKLEQYEHFSDEREALATVIYTGAVTVETDKEGRIMIPEDLAVFANLKESGPVTIMGRGPIFHIWEPGAGAAFVEAMRLRASGLTPLAARA
jgi:DNA-binding transcriptional regulator/RsmH inhibitor MraZ